MTKSTSPTGQLDCKARVILWGVGATGSKVLRSLLTANLCPARCGLCKWLVGDSTDA
jgi:hypothetical protein